MKTIESTDVIPVEEQKIFEESLKKELPTKPFGKFVLTADPDKIKRKIKRIPKTTEFDPLTGTFASVEKKRIVKEKINQRMEVAFKKQKIEDHKNKIIAALEKANFSTLPTPADQEKISKGEPLYVEEKTVEKKKNWLQRQIDWYNNIKW